MIQFDKIKIIIWDLDDTFWSGTLSEGKIQLIDSHVQLIKNSTDCGVINTICSKNNEEDVVQVLEKYGLAEYFVFSSINWEPKGQRIKNLLLDMSLRAPNALFIDDNISNLKEATFYNNDLMIIEPSEIPQLADYFNKKEKKDINHKRLLQYRLLEQKHTESLTYSSNEEFLYDCNIHLQIEKNCIDVEDRLFELTQRTNQLNFTKCRPTKEEFEAQLRKADDCGYIQVQDKFGDYGIVGFYLIKDERLVHFLFSCRTIGQGVEQYVYWKLGYPDLEIVGDVATTLNKTAKPLWIKEGKLSSLVQTCTISDHLLFKGPCDMSGMVGYLQMGDSLKTEFTFTDNEGHLIESHNHSAHILGLNTFSQESLARLTSECFFLTKANFESSIYSGQYKMVFLSTLIEGNYGRYRRKGTGEVVAYGHYNAPITDPSFWQRYIKSQENTFGYNITEDMLREFSEKYEFVGRTTPDEYATFIKKLLSWLPITTHLCLILGSEKEYEKENLSAYANRHKWHKEFNSRLMELKDNRLHFVNITDFINSQSDFTNNINHFSPTVYYKLSSCLKTLIMQVCGDRFKIDTNWKRYYVKRFIMPIANKIMPNKLFWQIHNLISKKI